MRWECRERFPRYRLPRTRLVSDPGMHHGTCVTHVPWCMSESLTRGDGANVPGIPITCTTRNFRYLARGPWDMQSDVSTCGTLWNVYKRLYYSPTNDLFSQSYRDCRETIMKESSHHTHVNVFKLKSNDSQCINIWLVATCMTVIYIVITFYSLRHSAADYQYIVIFL